MMKMALFEIKVSQSCRNIFSPIVRFLATPPGT